MLRLFRNFRRRLLIDGKFGKYLLYAIGEIIILIMGIVFALQVNNWNEKRLDRITEILILKAIKLELGTQLRHFQTTIDLNKEVIVSSQIILDHLENDLTYNDSLAYHFLAANYITGFSYSKGAFETLKSTSVNIITNEKLRIQIIDLYEVSFEHMVYLCDHLQGYYDHAALNIFDSRFDQAEYFDDPMTEKEWDGEMIPLDFERLKNDPKYKYFVKTFKNATDYFLNDLLVSQSVIAQIVLDIEKEIEELEK